MRLRVAKKLVHQAHQRGVWEHRGLYRRAAARFLRWRYRLAELGSIEFGFHWCDEQGRVRPPSGRLLDDVTRWAVTKVRYVNDCGPNKWVSTIFLGLDHAHGFGEPLWFETAMKIGTGRVQVLKRHHDQKSAREFHEMVVEALKNNDIWVEADATAAPA